MLKLTKIFHFEMAHAIHGYSGICKNLHGHSYELHVTVSSGTGRTSYLPEPGFLVDFKDIKKLVYEAVIKELDHHTMVSVGFISAFPEFSKLDNMIIMEAEPTTENILLYIRQLLSSVWPGYIKLISMKLAETKDSYAEWVEPV